MRTCEFTRTKFRTFFEAAWRDPQFVNCPAHLVSLAHFIFIFIFCLFIHLFQTTRELLLHIFRQLSGALSLSLARLITFHVK